MKWMKYPEIKRIEEFSQRDLYKYFSEDYIVVVQAKYDGSNVSIMKEGDEIKIYSRNRLAKADLRDDVILYFEKTFGKDWEKMFSKFLDGKILYFELQRTGNSPTKVEFHSKVNMILLDIYDEEHGWANPETVRIFAQIYGFNYPAVISEEVLLFDDEDYEFGRVGLMKELEEVIEYAKMAAKFHCIEGVVIKRFTGGPPYIKIKPEREKPKKDNTKGDKKVKDLDITEVRGAIDKARADLGDDAFKNKSKAMPLIAKYIKEEEKKHNAKCRVKIYDEYLKFLLDMEE